MTTLDVPVSEIRAIELMATVNEHGHLVPDHALPIEINERVRVLVLQSSKPKTETHEEMIAQMNRASNPVFAAIWDNDEDAEYDQYLR